MGVGPALSLRSAIATVAPRPAPTSRPRTTRGSRSSVTMAASRGPSVCHPTSSPSTCTGLSRTGPSVRPAVAATTTAATPAASQRRRSRARPGAASADAAPGRTSGNVALMTGGSADGVRDRSQELHDPWTPPGGDVVVEGDHLAVLHRHDVAPARARLDSVGRLLATLRVGQEDQVGVRL